MTDDTILTKEEIADALQDRDLKCFLLERRSLINRAKELKLKAMEIAARKVIIHGKTYTEVSKDSGESPSVIREMVMKWCYSKNRPFMQAEHKRQQDELIARYGKDWYMKTFTTTSIGYHFLTKNSYAFFPDEKTS